MAISGLNKVFLNSKFEIMITAYFLKKALRFNYSDKAIYESLPVSLMFDGVGFIMAYMTLFG
jgi:hypothetical protein